MPDSDSGPAGVESGEVLERTPLAGQLSFDTHRDVIHDQAASAGESVCPWCGEPL